MVGCRALFFNKNVILISLLAQSCDRQTDRVQTLPVNNPETPGNIVIKHTRRLSWHGLGHLHDDVFDYNYQNALREAIDLFEIWRLLISIN